MDNKSCWKKNIENMRDISLKICVNPSFITFHDNPEQLFVECQAPQKD